MTPRERVDRIMVVVLHGGKLPCRECTGGRTERTATFAPVPDGAIVHAGGMPERDPKSTLHRYLQIARDALLWKLDGLSEYDVRRPMVPTGTNLLGLVKHVASVEIGYFGATFGRPFDEQTAVVRRRRRAERRHVGDGRRVAPRHHRALSPGVGPFRCDDRHARPRLDRSRAVVARRSERGHAAHDPRAHDRRDQPPRRPRRRRPRIGRWHDRAAHSTTATCRRSTRRGGASTAIGSNTWRERRARRRAADRRASPRTHPMVRLRVRPTQGRCCPSGGSARPGRLHRS